MPAMVCRRDVRQSPMPAVPTRLCCHRVQFRRSLNDSDGMSPPGPPRVLFRESEPCQHVCAAAKSESSGASSGFSWSPIPAVQTRLCCRRVRVQRSLNQRWYAAAGSAESPIPVVQTRLCCRQVRVERSLNRIRQESNLGSADTTVLPPSPSPAEPQPAVVCRRRITRESNFGSADTSVLRPSPSSAEPQPDPPGVQFGHGKHACAAAESETSGVSSSGGMPPPGPPRVQFRQCRHACAAAESKFSGASTGSAWSPIRARQTRLCCRRVRDLSTSGGMPPPGPPRVQFRQCRHACAAAESESNGASMAVMVCRRDVRQSPMPAVPKRLCCHRVQFRWSLNGSDGMPPPGPPRVQFFWQCRHACAAAESESNGASMAVMVCRRDIRQSPMPAVRTRLCCHRVQFRRSLNDGDGMSPPGPPRVLFQESEPCQHVWAAANSRSSSGAS